MNEHSGEIDTLQNTLSSVQQLFHDGNGGGQASSLAQNDQAHRRMQSGAHGSLLQAISAQEEEIKIDHILQ